MWSQLNMEWDQSHDHEAALDLSKYCTLSYCVVIQTSNNWNDIRLCLFTSKKKQTNLKPYLIMYYDFRMIDILN